MHETVISSKQSTESSSNTVDEISITRSSFHHRIHHHRRHRHRRHHHHFSHHHHHYLRRHCESVNFSRHTVYADENHIILWFILCTFIIQMICDTLYDILIYLIDMIILHSVRVVINIQVWYLHITVSIYCTCAVRRAWLDGTLYVIHTIFN